MRTPSRSYVLAFSILVAAIVSKPSANFAQSLEQSGALSRSTAARDGGFASNANMATIPGPLRNFLRMSAISQKVSMDEVLPLMARNVVVEGYQYWQDKARKPTEYLTLLRDYLDQARALEKLAGADTIIRIEHCADAAPLLKILGYKMHEPCGPMASLETDDPEKAFLTVDSGFPLADLEARFRDDKTFSYPYKSSEVPILFSAKDWASEDKESNGDVVLTLLHNPATARLYWALSRMDDETRTTMLRTVGLDKLRPFASVLDFYGTNITIRSGKVVVPGGERASGAWKSLVGANPDSTEQFLPMLLSKDEGWLASYYDAISRLDSSRQEYLTDANRLHRYYTALRGTDVTPGPARPVFRPNPGLILLFTRLQIDANGKPHVPGNIEIWKEVFRRKSDSKLVRDWAKRANKWNSNDSEQFVEAMVSMTRSNSKDSPLQVYLTLNEMDRNRPAADRLTPQTVRLLADKHSRYANQYPIFVEFHGLNNASISKYISVAAALDKIQDKDMRANAVGIFQANIGLWEILARQEQIPAANLNDSWNKTIGPFASIVSATQLYDAARLSFGEVLRAAGAKPDISQDEIADLLAGPAQTSVDGAEVHNEVSRKIRGVLTAQRLVSLDTLFGLGSGLNRMEEGKAMADSLIMMAGELREFEMPKPIFTNRERSEWASGLYNNRHTAQQIKTDLAKTIKTANSPKEIAAARGELVPFLRDALVGLNYAYYEPPGAQMLHNNSLFVRSHDFSGEMTMGGEQAWQTPRIYGRGWSASGGAHLAGSLADLPYVLAQTEQDFIVPENTQSLIWEDLVPNMLTSAVLPRWWRVSRNELRAVALYQRTGEEIVMSAAEDEKLRPLVLGLLSDLMHPQRASQIESAIRSKRGGEAVEALTPAESFFLAAEFRAKYPGQASMGKAGVELDNLVKQHPDEVGLQRISKDFGSPHPALTQSYEGELLHIKPLPTFLGYSSRLMAESWGSNNLYWARLADEMGYAPVMLHRLIPELTHKMVSKIFATHLEDWNAVVRAMRETGEEFRLGKVAAVPAPAPGKGL